jgi:hypothetical protein
MLAQALRDATERSGGPDALDEAVDAVAGLFPDLVGEFRIGAKLIGVFLWAVM